MLTEPGTDCRLALRTLAKERRFTGAVVVPLALGIALNVTVLAVVNAYLIKTLPYPSASRLYNIVYAPPGQPSPRGLETLPWETLGDIIEHHIGWDLDMFYLIGGEYSVPSASTCPVRFFMRALESAAFPQHGAFKKTTKNPPMPPGVLAPHTQLSRISDLNISW